MTSQKKLLEFIVQNITGSNDFSIEEETDGEHVALTVSANPSIIGLIIGKEGRTIKNIRKIISVKATLLKKVVNVSVNEATD